MWLTTFSVDLERGEEAYLGPSLESMSLPDFDESLDGVSQAVSPKMVPEDAGSARMSHDVGIPFVQVVVGEGPVVQGRPCVMIFDEGNCSRGPHPQQSWGPPLAVH